jgi:hypothetical protein
VKRGPSGHLSLPNTHILYQICPSYRTRIDIDALANTTTTTTTAQHPIHTYAHTPTQPIDVSITKESSKRNEQQQQQQQ